MFDRNKVRHFPDFSGSSTLFTVEHIYEYGKYSPFDFKVSKHERGLGSSYKLFRSFFFSCICNEIAPPFIV